MALVTVALLAQISVTVSAVHISHLSAPSVVLVGDELLLDCDFSYQESESSQLDLKWYFNSSPFPIYQWVPSMQKGPQVIGDLFKNNLDLLYSAHNDTFKKHRALHILNPDHRFSGTYMCKVSSFVDEDFQQKDVLVIAAPRRVSLFPQIHPEEKSLLNVTCKIEDIYPTPSVELSWTVNGSRQALESSTRVVREGPTGLLEVTVTSLAERNMVELEGTLACQITIPKTEFYLREELELFEYPKLLGRYTSSTEEVRVGRTVMLVILGSVLLLSKL